MCDDITRPDEDFAGTIWRLCTDAESHITEYIGVVDEDSPIRRVIAALASHAAGAVFESQYFDLDYRSEMSRLQELSFVPRRSETVRLHFFSHEPSGEETSMHQYVRDARLTYRGYTVIKPQDVGVVGRSMISPYTSVLPRVSPETLTEQVRTAVEEHVQVFGVSLVAVGVPFMEQDGQLLTCAHVSAWICHYSAVLQGLVARRTTGMFHGAAERTDSIGRSYPSAGLAISELSHILREFDLPAEIHHRASLLTDRRGSWADRRLLRVELAANEDGSRRLRDNLAATICRHLNSSRPVILLRDSIGHSVVIVGYLRRKDLSDDEGLPAALSASDIHGFVVSDDQRGPFTFLSFDRLVQYFSDEDGNNSYLMTPLPRSVWMTGADAEELGVAWFSALAQRDSGDSDAQFDAFATGVPPEMPIEDESSYSVRTYLATGTSFKAGWSSRVTDDELSRVVGLVPLPRFIWVVEALHRDLRASEPPQPSVVGTLVFDATARVGRDNDERVAFLGTEPLFAHVPAAAYVYALATYETAYSDSLEDFGALFSDEGWLPGPNLPYWSGRKRFDMSAPATIFDDDGQFKRAVPGL